MYSNVALVREISGMVESNISNTRIVSKILTADAMIDGAISERYVLPINKHWQNTITFSGEATEDGTASITINGSTYDMSIVDGNTASTIADKLRIACSGGAGFVLDSIGSGAVVNLISLSVAELTAYDQLDITAITTVAGVTISEGIITERYPPAIMYLSADIATALLLQEEYGTEAEGTAKDGFLRMQTSLEKLQRIQGILLPMTPLFDEVTKIELAQSVNNDVTSNLTREASISMDGVL